MNDRLDLSNLLPKKSRFNNIIMRTLLAVILIILLVAWAGHQL